MARDKLVEDLIRRELLREEGKRRRLKLDIKVEDKEIEEVIRKDAAFQTGGKFDELKYADALANPNINWEKIRAQIKEAIFKNKETQLLPAKVQEVLTRGVKVTDQEVRQEYLNRNEKAKINYVAFDPAAYNNQVTFEAKELTEYWDQHQKDFKRGESRRVKYLFINPEAFKDQVSTPETALETYYQKHRDQYKRLAEVRARHILLKSPPDATGEAEAKRRIEDIKIKIKAGEDFAELAKKYSEDPGSAPQGGDLGFFSRGRMVPEFEKAAFALSTGEVSGVVKTTFGYHILRLEEKRGPGIQPFAEVVEKVRGAYVAGEARRLAKGEGERILKAILQGTSFETFAGTREITLHESPLFVKGEGIPEAGTAPEFHEAVFKLKLVKKPATISTPEAATKVPTPELSGVIDTPRGFYLTQLLEAKAPYLQPTEEVKGRLEELVQREKAREAASREAGAFSSKAKIKKNLEELAREATLEVKSLGPFGRADFFIDNQFFFELVRPAFEVKVGEVSRSIENAGKFYVIKMTERGIDEAKYKKEKKALKEELLRQRQEKFLNDWFTAARKRARIVNYLKGR